MDLSGVRLRSCLFTEKERQKSWERLCFGVEDFERVRERERERDVALVTWLWYGYWFEWTYKPVSAWSDNRELG